MKVILLVSVLVSLLGCTSREERLLKTADKMIAAITYADIVLGAGGTHVLCGAAFPAKANEPVTYCTFEYHGTSFHLVVQEYPHELRAGLVSLFDTNHLEQTGATFIGIAGQSKMRVTCPLLFADCLMHMDKTVPELLGAHTN